MSFGMVNIQVMADPTISVRAKSLYGLLCCYKNEHNICKPDIKLLSDKLNVGQSTIYRRLKELKDAGVISWSQFKLRSTYTTVILK